MSSEGRKISVGYYTVRFVDAPSRFEAPAAALALFFERSARPDPSEWTCESEAVFAARWWSRRFRKQPGFVFYSLDDAAEADEQADLEAAADGHPGVRIYAVDEAD